MLPVGDKSIIQHQLHSLERAGVDDVSIIRGYAGHEIKIDKKVAFFENKQFERNNILESLFCAAPAITGNVVISYSDILFSHSVVEALLASTCDITVVVDKDWQRRYVGRTMHPVEEAEKVIVAKGGWVTNIGKHLKITQPIFGEFIGMLRLSVRGAAIFNEHYERCKQLHHGKAFQQAATFSTAYLTDFIQDLSDRGERIGVCEISGGWIEIDTVEDLDRARTSLDEFL